MQETKQRFSPEAVGRRYGVARSTVIQWCEAGLLPAVDVAGPKAKRRRWRISEEDVAAFEQRRGNTRPADPVGSGRKGARTVARPVKDYLSAGGAQ
jgi:hypothetical protein